MILGVVMGVGEMSYTKEDLEKLRYALPGLNRGTRGARARQELLKSYGFSRGLRRWHFFGKQGGVYHPPPSFLTPPQLDSLYHPSRTQSEARMKKRRKKDETTTV